MFQVVFGGQGRRGVWPCLNNAGCFLRNREKKAFLELNNGAVPAGSVQRIGAGGVLWALLLEVVILMFFSSTSYESGISPGVGLLGLLSVGAPGLGAASIVFLAWWGKVLKLSS